MGYLTAGELFILWLGLYGRQFKLWGKPKMFKKSNYGTKLYYILYLMGPSLYMRSVADRNVVTRRMTVHLLASYVHDQFLWLQEDRLFFTTKPVSCRHYTFL